MHNSHPDYPSAYTQGKIEFFYLPFFTDERALIPRLETEDLVREAINLAKTKQFDAIIDIGTGSGIIAVTCAKHIKTKKVIAIDVSPKALELAKKNADFHKISVFFFEGNLFTPIISEDIGNSILIVTNLPYIPEGATDLSSDTIFEPQNALFGGKETGFELYDELFEQISLYSQKYPEKNIDIIGEMAEDQYILAEKAAGKYGFSVRIFSDIFGVPRFFHMNIAWKI